jgi:hypothetical protein
MIWSYFVWCNGWQSKQISIKLESVIEEKIILECMKVSGIDENCKNRW